MQTGTVILIVGVGVAGYLFWRSQNAQAIATAQAQAAAAGGIPATGGGIGGVLQRAAASWRADPLGIQNAKNVVGYVGGAASSVAGDVTSGISYVSHLF